MEKFEAYTRVRAKDNNEYICPLHLTQNQEKLRADQLEDCVEAEVVGRYIGHLKIIASK